jgi:DNA-binding HxlR family transcriptional regulator
VPSTAWQGYGRFCPLARSLDVVGDRWTLVILQELQKRPSRFGELARRLPGIGTTVLTERLRKLEAAGVVERRLGSTGAIVTYAVGERGLALGDALEALRRWGVNYLTDPSADGADCHRYDMHYVSGIDALDDGVFGLVVDGAPSTLRFSSGRLEHFPGPAADPRLVVSTSGEFMDRWAAGASSWDDGLASGAVTVTGPLERWHEWLAATGYLLAYRPEDGR